MENVLSCSTWLHLGFTQWWTNFSGRNTSLVFASSFCHFWQYPFLLLGANYEMSFSLHKPHNNQDLRILLRVCWAVTKLKHRVQRITEHLNPSENDSITWLSNRDWNPFKNEERKTSDRQCDSTYPGLFLCKESQSRHKRALESRLISEGNSLCSLHPPPPPTSSSHPRLWTWPLTELKSTYKGEKIRWVDFQLHTIMLYLSEECGVRIDTRRGIGSLSRVVTL